MSSSVPPTQLQPLSLLSDLTPSQAAIFGPNIIGIFIQGIESGLVFSQFSRWYFRPDRSGSYVVSIVVIFVTVVGLYASSRLFSAPSHQFIKCADRDIICIGLV
jgi:hypothetical protein